MKRNRNLWSHAACAALFTLVTACGDDKVDNGGTDGETDSGSGSTGTAGTDSGTTASSDSATSGGTTTGASDSDTATTTDSGSDTGTSGSDTSTSGGSGGGSACADYETPDDCGGAASCVWVGNANNGVCIDEENGEPVCDQLTTMQLCNMADVCAWNSRTSTCEPG